MAKLSTTHIYGDLYVDGIVSGALSGNATTATTLQTARTINGTSFNGSANITTANWGTSRTITIGSTGKSVNGSGNVSWTLAEIGAAAASHGTHLTLGTGSGNAYRGDYGNTAYTHSQAAHAPSNAQKNSDITKAEIEAKLTGDITSHNHNIIIGQSGSSWTTATKDVQTDCRFEFASHITKSATGLFPVDNNANAIISFNRHSGPHASQLGFSSNGKIYYRWGNGTALTDSTAWQQIYTSSNKPTAADIGAAAASHGTHLTIGTGASNAAAGNHTHNYAGSSSAGGAANSVKTNLIIKLNGGSTEGTNLFTFNGGTAKTVNITPSAIGAAASSHGTHLTIGTGASNAAAGNHTHNYAASSHTHNNIVHQDTRDANTTPDGAPIGLSVHLKTNGTDGLSDGGTYHSSLFIKGWDDYSGGPYGNIAISANNNLWFRSSSSGTAWNSWKRVSVYGHSHTLFTRSSVGDIGWGTESNRSLPTAVSALAYWNGAYQDTASNLAYCKHGAFGTMATKSSGSYLALSGGTMTGPIKNSTLHSSWVGACNAGAFINGTKSAGDFQPMLSGVTNSGRMTLAYYQASLQSVYITKANCDAGTNTIGKHATIMDEGGSGSWGGSLSATGVFTRGSQIGLATSDGATFQACFRISSSRALCDLGNNTTPGQLMVRSGQGTGGSAVSVICAVTNGTNYMQYLSPEAGTIALTKHLSDRTRKENIAYVDTEECNYSNKDFYEFIKDNLELATYTLKKEYAATDTHTKLNFIAQDILWDFDKQEENKVGNLIVQAEEAMEEQLSLKYDPEVFTSVIAGALKEAINKIEQLEAKIEQLESKQKGE